MKENLLISWLNNSIAACRKILVFFELDSSRSIKSPTVVSFTGGMGAQILSASIYYHYKKLGKPVYADLSYFKKDKHLASEGIKGEVSHWDWQLSTFGIELDSFKNLPSDTSNSNFLPDGLKKAHRGFEALKCPEIREHFSIKNNQSRKICIGHEEDYICVHVRRGDYINVASHIISDDQFIAVTNKFSKLIPNLVVISDSQIDDAFKNSFKEFSKVIFLDEIQPYDAHCIMREAKILVCSNSQFSLTAGLLNPNGLVILPKNWFGNDNKLNELVKPIHDSCHFQVFT